MAPVSPKGAVLAVVVALVLAGVFVAAYIYNEERGIVDADSVVVAFGAAGAMGIVFFMMLSGRKKLRNMAEHGSARWSTKAEAKLYMDPDPENNVILTKTEGLTMNSRPAKPEYARNKNILVIGASGSGKTRYFLKPGLMQCESADYPTAFCVTDPKGTIMEECGAMLVKKGYDISFINTIDFTRSMRYNPFHYIKTEKDILSFVTVLMANTNAPGAAQGGDDFWGKSEKLMYMALIGYMMTQFDPAERNFDTLIRMLNMMQVLESDEGFMNPVDVAFEILETGKARDMHPEVMVPKPDAAGGYTYYEAEDGLIKSVKEKIKNPNYNKPFQRATYKDGVTPRIPEPDCFAVRVYKKYKIATGKTAKSILITCGARLAPFDIPQIMEMTRSDEMELDKLGDFVPAPMSDRRGLPALRCPAGKIRLLRREKRPAGRQGAKLHAALAGKPPWPPWGRKAALPDAAAKTRRPEGGGPAGEGLARYFYMDGGKKVPVAVGKGGEAYIAGKGAGRPAGAKFVKVKKRALFVMISDTDAAFNFIASIMYSQLFNILATTADVKHKGRLPVHVRFLLDEFPNIGLIPNFEKLIATIRSREMSASIVVQTLSQLKAIYKDNMDTIVGNCDSQLFLGGNEKFTLEYVSKMLGQETIDASQQSRQGSSYSRIGRDLMTVQELSVMKGNTCVLMIRGEQPFRSRKYDIAAHRNYRFTADHDPGNYFDVHGYLEGKRAAGPAPRPR